MPVCFTKGPQDRHRAVVLNVYCLDKGLRPYRALPASGLPNPIWASFGKLRMFFCYDLEGSQTRLYIRMSKQGQKSDTVGLAGMRPRQPHHLQPSWSGCCAARVGTTDSCEWGEGSRRCPSPASLRHQVVRYNERAAWLTSCTFCRSATMLVLSFCSFSSVSRSFLSEVRRLSSEALARESARLW